MAVDIKQLRIGSHISINGERVEVESLQGGDLVGCITPDNDWFATESWRFEPISITPALLKELGFEERRREYPYGTPDVWYIDREAAQLEKKNNLVVPTMTVFPLGQAGYPDWWVIKLVIGDKPMRTDNCTVRYLHEAEAFLALHGVELINE